MARHDLGGAARNAPFASFGSYPDDVYQVRYYVGLDARPVTITTPHTPVSPMALRATRCLAARAGDMQTRRAVADNGW